VARHRLSRERSAAAGNTLTLEMSDGTKVVVPRSLAAISSYVLLEQERWFEKETDFVAAYLQPGMSTIDIGANVGVYALSMARRVGPHGRVFAFEPSSETRGFLAAGIEANGLTNITVSSAALSDQPGQAVLVHGASSELHSLKTDGPGEPVTLTTLDAEDAAGRWQRVDFLKLDAEGAEERILAGAQEFFRRHVPLVMFEIKAGSAVNTGLMVAFRALDFAVFRSLPEKALLVPSDIEADLDPFELNLFAVPPHRVAALAASGFLISEHPVWQPSQDDVEHARQRIAEAAFHGAFKGFWPDLADLAEPYRAGLAGFAVWRFGKEDWARRYAALTYAVSAFEAFARSNASCASLSMLARAQLESGQRGKAVGTLRALAHRLAAGDTSVPVPFWPSLARFDSIDPGTQAATWLRVSVFEQLERAAHFSTVFSGRGHIDLAFIADKPFAHIEMERRRVLVSALSGKVVDVPKRLWPITPDHRNAQVWRHGLVPNTRRRRI
jgi:FkbM family methyltransferase